MVFLYTVDRHILLDLQAGQHGSQAQIALLEVGNSGHDLLVGYGLTGLLQLLSQCGQLIGMGGVVAHHVLHQCSQLFHGGVLAVAVAGAAFAAAIVGMIVAVLMTVVMAMLVGMVVGVTLAVEMIVLMGMDMVMLMGMGVGMGMGDTVVGVLMGMGVVMLVGMGTVGVMIVMQMHKSPLLCNFLLLYPERAGMSKHLFGGEI